MKKYKQIDFYVSVILLIASVVFSLIILNQTFIYTYFLVGGWQIISMMVHTTNKWFTQKGGDRYLYHFTVIVFVITALLGIVAYPFLFVFLILLFAAPFMALFYTYICYKEVYIKMKRPLDDLK